MAALGGMLAAAILKVVSDQIGSVIGGQITLQKNFDKELKKMKMALESVDAVLEDAERRSITDKPTLLWLKRLKDFMYEISDMIDEFEADTQAITQPSERKFFFKRYLAAVIPCLTIGPRITMANKMEKMKEGLELITDQHKKFKLTEGIYADEPKVTDIRETSSTLETHIIGRTEEKDKILASLSESMEKEITILSIYGIGGLGKTTLTKMIYSSSQFKEYSQVWVYVSQTFDLKKIGNSIISQLSEKGEESKYTEKQMIHKSLQRLLADKKILIVLDDLWETNISHLDELKDMLKVGEGSNVVVIVTTRDEGIAKKISTIQPHKLAPLTDDMCWSIIKQKSAFESKGDKEQLEEIGKVIAVKCAGVALAAKSVGHTLQSMNYVQWEAVRDSNIWTASSLDLTYSTQVLASLKLSYSVMPSYLKLCFAYCAIFPKGYKILKDDLIHQWVSLGFSTWELAKKCISQLLGLSFLEQLKSSSTMEMYEDITVLTMHDLVHDLARSVMDDDILVIDKGDNGMGSCYHYALLDDCNKPLCTESSKIRALRFMNCDKTKVHDTALSSAKSLRVLDLSECVIHKLADCIGELKQLRYLNAPRVQDAKIPNSITKLSKLIYLNLHGSPTILALPESIGEIEGLMYLDLSCCSGIKELPESFGRLKELVHLDFSNCSHVEGISMFLGSFTQLKYLNLSYCPNIGEIPEAMGGLSKLQYLNLSFSSYIESCQQAKFLGTLAKLEYLYLSSKCCHLQKLPEGLGKNIQLKYLNLSGCKEMMELPRDFGSLKNLLHLDLSHCRMVDSLHEALIGLTNLQYLNLKGACPSSWDPTKLQYMSEGTSFDNLINHISSHLSNLQHLCLSDNHTITSIPESICSLRKLHTLDLSRCTRLEKIPESMHTIGSLRFLYLTGCHSLSKIPQLDGSTIPLPIFPVRVGDNESSSNLVLLQPIDPVVLQITELENVKSSGEAHHIKLMEKQSLLYLKLEWTRDAPRFVNDKILLEKLVPPSTLQRLDIFGYNSVSFPAWPGQLPNLELVELRGMANLEEWNLSHPSGEEYILQRLEIHDCPMLRMKPPLPKPKYWEISNSDNVLSSLDECTVSNTRASSSSPITNILSVKDCKGPHQWRLLQHFPGLSYLFIEDCGDLTGSPEIAGFLSSVETLRLGDQHMEELPKWLGELTSLKDLTIRRSGLVKELNENMKQLTKLQSLELDSCDSISLPHWLGELTSLRRLVISGSDVLRSLPESIQQLTSLQEICILFCSEKFDHLVAEPEEEKMKLTHNQERVCGLPASLKELTFEGTSIKSLPKGIQQLTNLQSLVIYDSPELEQWCELEENKMKLAHIEEKIIGWVPRLQNQGPEST